MEHSLCLASFERRALSKKLLAGMAALSFMSVAHGQLILDLSDAVLQANTANQPVTITLQNTSGSPLAVNALQFNLQVDPSGPTITAINLIAGTIFQNNHLNQFSSAITPRLFEASIATDENVSPTVNIPAGGSTIATAFFNTTGISLGSYNYTVNTVNGPVTYATTTATTYTPQMLDGVLTVVPEPSTYATIAGIGCVVFAAYRRQARR